MTSSYDKYYQTENLFGAPYPELLIYFKSQIHKGHILDLGCGQGRNSIPLARLGYSVTGLDTSHVGVDQMKVKASKEGLQINGIVADIYKIDQISGYDFLLLDSMFHFEKKDKAKEVSLIKKLVKDSSHNCTLVFCVPDNKRTVSTLRDSLSSTDAIIELEEITFMYNFEDVESGHFSKSEYRMFIARKIQ